MKTIHITVEGEGWGGGRIRYEYDIRKIVRFPEKYHAGELFIDKNHSMQEALEEWLTTNSGDFESITAWEALEIETTTKVQVVGSRGELTLYDEEE